MTNKSDIGELKSATRLAEAGYEVSIPFSDESSYDLVAEKNGNFHKVQCKKARLKDGTIKAELRRINRTSSGVEKQTYSEDEVDWYTIYCPETEEVYLIDYKDAPDTAITLRVKEPEIDRDNIKFAKRYIL